MKAEAAVAWLAGNKSVYIDNATARRDFRVQLRGVRSVLLFGIYLVALIGVTMLSYSSAVNASSMSIVAAQQLLRAFYHTTMTLLGLTVCVVAPGLTATSIVMERQRQSIDLVFSAPVTPKYYLVGKMLASFRYTWMLLVLALPVTAASVVLGGASWSDVILAYVLLSFQGMMLTAFALLMSTISPKPIGAIIWSYAATLLYGVATMNLADAYSHGINTGRSGGEAPFWLSLSPFAVSESARTYTTISGHAIPNWILLAIAALLITKICLLGAGSLLSGGVGKEVVGLRIHGLIYTAALFGLVGWETWQVVSSLASREGAYNDPMLTPSGTCGMTTVWLLAPIITFLPFLACYGYDRERRFLPNGLFKPGRILDGTPAGGLPYLLAIVLGAFASFAVAGRFGADRWLGSAFWNYAFFAVAFWGLFWAIGRLISSLTPELRTARTLLFCLFVLIVALPFPFLLTVAGSHPDAHTFSLWDLYILCPVVGQRPDGDAKALVYGGILLGLAVLIAAIAEFRTRKRLASMRNYDEQPFDAAATSS